MKKKEFKIWAVAQIDKGNEEELKQRLFEVCEDWVLKGQEPDLEFK